MPLQCETLQVSISPREDSTVDQPDEYGVGKGDSFTFDVYRGILGELNFRSESPSPLAEPLVWNLPNGRHTIELITNGDDEVVIRGMYVF